MKLRQFLSIFSLVAALSFAGLGVKDAIAQAFDGIVLDQDGQPVEGAVVEFTSRMNRGMIPFVGYLTSRDMPGRTITKGDGSYSVGTRWESFKYTGLAKEGYAPRATDVTPAANSDSRLIPFLVWDEGQQKWTDRLFLFKQEKSEADDIRSGESDWHSVLPDKPLILYPPDDAGKMAIETAEPGKDYTGALLKVTLGRSDTWQNDWFGMEAFAIRSLGKGIVLCATDMNHAPKDGYVAGYVVNLSNWDFRPSVNKKNGVIWLYGVNDESRYYSGRIEINQRESRIRWRADFNTTGQRILPITRELSTSRPIIPPVAGRVYWNKSVLPILTDEAFRALWKEGEEIRGRLRGREALRDRNSTWNGRYFNRYFPQDIGELLEHNPFLPIELCEEFIKQGQYGYLLSNRGCPADIIDRLSETGDPKLLVPQIGWKLSEREKRRDIYEYYREFFVRLKNGDEGPHTSEVASSPVKEPQPSPSAEFPSASADLTPLQQIQALADQSAEANGIKSINVSPAKGGDNAFAITGRAKSPSEVAGFMAALGKSPYVSQVELEYARLTNEKPNRVTEFSIICRFKAAQAR